MRKFAWSLTALCALTIGCNKPVETIPAVTPEPVASSGTTLSDDEHAGHDHDHDGDHDHADHAHAEGAGHDTDKKVEGAVEAATENTEGAEEPKAEAPKAEEAVEPSAANAKLETIRFVADKRISVPTMMCPYSCWPKVKETLASQPGVEAVQLAQQPEGTAEGEINKRVVELKLNGDFDADAAIAALKKVSFKAELAN